MAVGQLLGHPWFGVLLSMGAMVMAMTWMLQGWFPPQWALLGGVLIVVRFGLFTHWVDSYYNGSVADHRRRTCAGSVSPHRSFEAARGTRCSWAQAQSYWRAAAQSKG